MGGAECPVPRSPPGRRRRSRSECRSSFATPLLEQHIDELAALITEENGKIDREARAEVLKSAELTEFACSLPQIAAGEVLEVSRGVECRIERFPVGVVAAITPFNFPNMVPNWSIPNAIALGNCLILKPSELVPLSAGRIARIVAGSGPPRRRAAGGARRAGIGRSDLRSSGHRRDQVRGLDADREGRLSSRLGEPSSGCLALGGAKNHLIVMPDADVEMTASNIVASMSGCAGQRCMAASVMVAVRLDRSHHQPDGRARTNGGAGQRTSVR